MSVPPPPPEGERTYEFWRPRRRRRCQFARHKLDKRSKLLISFKIIRARVTFQILKESERTSADIRALSSVMQKCLESPPPFLPLADETHKHSSGWREMLFMK